MRKFRVILCRVWRRRHAGNAASWFELDRETGRIVDDNWSAFATGLRKQFSGTEDMDPVSGDLPRDVPFAVLSMYANEFAREWRRDGAVREVEKKMRSFRRQSRRALNQKFDRLGFWLPRKIRKEAWEPYRQEILEDYVEHRRRDRAVGSGRHFFVVAHFKAAFAFAQCLWLSIGEKGRRWLGVALPEAVRQWWLGGR